jgi:hypothetical protein
MFPTPCFFGSITFCVGKVSGINYLCGMNSTEIFSIALGLNSPWYVEKAEFLNSSEHISKELHLYLNFVH